MADSPEGAYPAGIPVSATSREVNGKGTSIPDHVEDPGGPVERFAHRVLNFLFRRRDIVIDGQLYLRRWYVTPRKLPLRLFLHCIVRSDDVRCLHTHPWKFAPLILARGYIEHLPGNQTRERRPGSFKVLPPDHTHAVEVPGKPAWTLCLVWQATKEWGFVTNQGWVDWRTYLGQPDAPDWPEDKIQ